MSMEYDPILYDSDPRAFLNDEVLFYEKLVDELHPKTILELGVGTGRIFSKIISKVEHGTGIDLSRSMLDVCKKKCIDSNFDLCELSFINFDLGRKYDFVYMPFNTFQHVLTEEDQLKCLESIRRHMHQKSLFVLDVMNTDNVELSFNDWSYEYSGVLPNGNKFEREQKTTDINPRSHVVQKVFRYKEFDNDKKIIKVYEFDALMKINPNNDMRNILELSGLKIEKIKYGYSSIDDAKNSKKIIYFLRKNEI